VKEKDSVNLYYDLFIHFPPRISSQEGRGLADLGGLEVYLGLFSNL